MQLALRVGLVRAILHGALWCSVLFSRAVCVGRVCFCVLGFGLAREPSVYQMSGRTLTTETVVQNCGQRFLNRQQSGLLP